MDPLSLSLGPNRTLTLIFGRTRQVIHWRGPCGADLAVLAIKIDWGLKRSRRRATHVAFW
jgi:hypothetical protein